MVFEIMTEVSQAADALMTNRSSLFDDPLWLDVMRSIGLLKEHALDRAAKGVMQQTAQIPGLVRLVRDYDADPSDAIGHVQMLNLIENLRIRDLEIQSDLETLVSIIYGVTLEPFTWARLHG